MITQRVLRSAALGVTLLFATGRSASAQATTASFDTAAVHGYTIDALVRASRTTLGLVRDANASAPFVRMLDSLLQLVDRPVVTRLPLDILVDAQFGTGPQREAGLGKVARWQRRAIAPGLGAEDAADLSAMVRLTLGEVQNAMELRQPPVPDDSIDILLTPFTALQRSQLQLSLTQSLERLNRFERKYGPGAPRLNVVEVGLNYVAQWVPLLRPDSTGAPSRFEVVSSYVPTYLTLVDGNARAVTVAELGLRSYLWRRGWGGTEGGILRPGYLSFGVALSGDQDGAFVSPLRGKTRVGGFFGWGETKFAVLGGSERRFLVTRQIQLVPWVF